jgi:tetratricopeptide (TPR) repeat protein
MALNNLGLAQEAAGEIDGARRSFEESIALSRRHGLTEILPYALASLAHLELRASPHDALGHYRESLTLLRDLEDRRGVAYCLEGVAAAQAQLGNHAAAATLLGAAARIRDQTGAALSHDEQAEVDTIDAQSRAALSSDAFGRAWDEGEVLDAAASADWALRLLEETE